MSEPERFELADRFNEAQRVSEGIRLEECWELMLGYFHMLKFMDWVGIDVAKFEARKFEADAP